MIGAIDQLEGWASLIDAATDPQIVYYCQCVYVPGQPNCLHHGDPHPDIPWEKRQKVDSK